MVTISQQSVMADDPIQRVRVAQSLLAVVVYLFFAGIHEVEVSLGLIDPVLARGLSLFTLAGAIGFYALVRSGLNQRWFRHAAVTQAQCLFGVLCATMAYAVNGPTRGAVMMIMLLILVFGMFALRPNEARRVGAFGLALLGGVMAWSASADPSGRPAAIEFANFLFLIVGVATVLVLSERLGTMRGAMAEQKMQLEEALARLHELSIRDELTGLVNRRHVNLQLQSELARHETDGESLSVALIDIDHFKRVNDQHGHAVGDAVLQTFSRVAAEELRATDVLARWGGEEFLLLMPLTPEPLAIAALERLRATLRHQPASIAEPGLRITFSAGVASLRPGDTVSALIERADRAMYLAKDKGRDKTVVAAG